MATTLDASGQATVDLLSTGEVGSASGSLPPSTSSPPKGAERSDTYAVSLRTSVLQVYEAPDLSTQTQMERGQAALIMESLAQTTTECAAGIAAGESSTWGETGCDFFSGLIPAVGSYQLARDSFKTSEKFIEGKQNWLDYVTAGVLVVAIAVAALPAVKPAIDAIKGAIAAAPSAEMQQRLAREAVGIARRGLEDANAVSKLSASARLLSAGDSAAFRALKELEPKLDDIGKAALDTIADRLGDDALVVLANIAKHPDFGDDVMKKLTEVLGHVDGTFVTTIEGLPRIRPTALTKTIEGMATFMKIAPNIPVRRIRRSWAHIQQAIPGSPEQQAQKLENLYSWISEASPHNIPGFDNFVKKGLGTIPTSSAGFYHPLEYLVVELFRNGKKIRALEYKEGHRFIDILLEDGSKIELKNLLSGSAEIADGFARQIGKDVRSAINSVTLEHPLGAALAELSYVLRANQAQFVEAANNIRAALERNGLSKAEALLVRITRFGIPPFDP